MDKIEQIDVLINILINRHSLDVPHETSSIEDSFEHSLRECQNYIESHEECLWISNYPDDNTFNTGDYYWEYVKFGLKILKCLKDHILSDTTANKSDSSTDRSRCTPILLNVKQQNCIKSLCEFIMCLGVGRNLLPGIGIPWESRSKFTRLVPRNLSFLQGQLQLYSTLNILMELSQYHLLGNMLFSQCLQDLLAGLCQLAFWQLNKVIEIDIDITKLKDVKKSSHDLLRIVLEKAYQPKVVKELLFLQGSVKQSNACNLNAALYFRQKVSNLLLERLMKKQGVKSLIMAILESGDNGEKSEQRNWMKCEVAARLISSFTTDDEHNALLIPQILELLNYDSQDKETKHQFIRIGKLIVVNIVSKNSQVGEHMIFGPLFKDLIDWSTNKEHLRFPTFDKDFEDCVTKLHQIFTFDAGFSKKFMIYLSRVLGILFCVYSYLKESILHVKTLIEQILISYFKNVGETDLISISNQILFHFDKINNKILLWNPDLNDIGTDVEPEPKDLEWIQIDHLNTITFCKLIEIVKDDKLTANVFLWLLQNLSLSFDTEDSKLEETSTQSQFLQMEEIRTRKEINFRKLLLSLNILSTLFDKYDLYDALLEHKIKILTFIERILERGAKHCQSSDLFHDYNSETIRVVAVILSLLLENEKDFKTIKTQTKCIITSLKTISEKHSDENIKTLTLALYKFISTMGAVPIAQVIIESCSQINIDDTNTPSTSQNKVDARLTPYQQLWMDLNDEDIPTKGHALLTCTKLLQAREDDIMKDKEKLLPLLIESLAHGDSYIYLMCTQTLTTLAVEFPNFVMPILLEKYGDHSNSLFQMKIGEVLLKFVSQLNDVVVKYREPLISAFMNATKTSDPLIRASSLSNLGQLFQGLKYSLGPNVNEIFLHLTNFAKCDSNFEVRSAAVQVITLLLRGLGKDSLTILDTILKDMYRLLKHVYRVDKNEIVKLHVQLALQELDILCREFCFPKQVLEKKISILK